MLDKKDLQQIKNIFDDRFDKMDDRFDKMERTVDRKIDELALMTKDSFDKVDDRFDRLENRVEKLESGQQRIEMHLMNVVHRSEFEKLKEQVEILQRKVGVV